MMTSDWHKITRERPTGERLQSIAAPRSDEGVRNALLAVFQPVEEAVPEELDQLLRQLN